jgi:hypothetical protein
MSAIPYDHAEQKDHNMLAHPREVGFEVDFSPLKFVVAVVAVIAISVILIAVGQPALTR